jgi:hypothetical protein
MGTPRKNTIVGAPRESQKFYRADLHRADLMMSSAPHSPAVIARLDRAIQHAAAVVMNLDASGMLDARLRGA